MVAARALMLLGGAYLVGCGGGGSASGTYHCATPEMPPAACIEHVNISGEALEAAQAGCERGVWGAGPCPTANRLGGCELFPGDTDWYYAGGKFSSSQQVMDLCTRIGATFVPGS